ncbi:MAG: nicotinamide mononucleotide transporter PnuC, partial [Erysipelotrichaceae bacterium]|nr:nicotinamide mononucleotide transporter PnuC [Erysipelotrichaceae bacterium]
MEKLKNHMEPNREVRIAEQVVLVLLLAVSVFSYVRGSSQVNSDPGTLNYQGTVEMVRNEDLEDYDEDSTVCDVVYTDGEDKLIVSYPYEEYEELENDSITAHAYLSENGTKLFFDHMDPSAEEVKNTCRQITADRLMPLFNLANALIILAV